MKLTAQEELALRRLGNQAMSIAPDVARPLVRLALAEPYRDGWRLTPSGLQHYKALPKTPLQNGSPSLVIDNILNRAIPLARSRSILQPENDDARDEERT